MNRTLYIPVGPHGTILDPSIGDTLAALAGPAFNADDVFLFSHGWWTSAADAMIDYGRFSVGLAQELLGRPTRSLEIGLHWPAVVSENPGLVANLLEPLSFWSRGRMADTVGAQAGYAVLRLILEARKAAGIPAPRLHLIGHSFGCRVVCSALQTLAKDWGTRGLLNGGVVNVVLLQAAFNDDELERDQMYGAVSQLPGLRMLVTRSGQDFALRDMYPCAQRAVNLFKAPVPALGYTGSADAPRMSIDLGYTPDGPLANRELCVDLSALHLHDGEPSAAFVGHHSDIYRPEIYRLLARWLAPTN